MKDPISQLLCVLLTACAQTTSDRDVTAVEVNERASPGQVILVSKENQLSHPSTISRVELRYRDASTPPQYHRSYTIMVTPDAVAVSVDVYGKVIAKGAHPLNADQWVQLTNDVAKLGPNTHQDREDATGGSGYTLGVVASEGTHAHAWGHDTTPMALRLTDVARQIEHLVPDLAELRQTPY